MVDWEHQDLVAHISGLPVVVEEEPKLIHLVLVVLVVLVVVEVRQDQVVVSMV